MTDLPQHRLSCYTWHTPPSCYYYFEAPKTNELKSVNILNFLNHHNINHSTLSHTQHYTQSMNYELRPQKLRNHKPQFKLKNRVEMSKELIIIHTEYIVHSRSMLN